MLPNVARWEQQLDKNGKPVMVAIPFNCACGQPSNYGYAGLWHCTFCWQRLEPWKEHGNRKA